MGNLSLRLSEVLPRFFHVWNFFCDFLVFDVFQNFWEPCQSTIKKSCLDVCPGLHQYAAERIKGLAKGHNTLPLVKLEPETP